MSNNMKNRVVLVGAGQMAVDYSKVLTALRCDYDVIGRGERSAAQFYEKTGVRVATGGVEAWGKRQSNLPSCAIVAVNIETLFATTCELMRLGIQNILVEKPAGLHLSEIETLWRMSSEMKCRLFVAYNRRFYASVQKAAEMIRADGGVSSYRFEFTEWSHRIKDLQKPSDVLRRWFLGNSTHVVDLAFYLGGKPAELSAYTSGGTSWHPSSSVFAGAGKSEAGALFSYYADWEAPGRWALEVLTKNNLYILKPLESLQIQKLGSVETSIVPIDDSLDKQFKPGLYEEVKAFLSGDDSIGCTIADHCRHMQVYSKIAGYE